MRPDYTVSKATKKMISDTAGEKRFKFVCILEYILFSNKLFTCSLYSILIPTISLIGLSI